jgi:hypothetical protein
MTTSALLSSTSAQKLSSASTPTSTFAASGVRFWFRLRLRWFHVRFGLGLALAAGNRFIFRSRLLFGFFEKQFTNFRWKFINIKILLVLFDNRVVVLVLVQLRLLNVKLGLASVSKIGIQPSTKQFSWNPRVSQPFNVARPSQRLIGAFGSGVANVVTRATEDWDSVVVYPYLFAPHGQVFRDMIPESQLDCIRAIFIAINRSKSKNDRHV